jgi:hypothetical protein
MQAFVLGFAKFKYLGSVSCTAGSNDASNNTDIDLTGSLAAMYVPVFPTAFRASPNFTDQRFDGNFFVPLFRNYDQFFIVLTDSH